MPALLLLLLALSPLAAQQARPGSGSPMSDAGSANLPGQRIGPNDLLAISVYDAPELTRTLRVSAEGTLRLPMVSKPLRAAGLLPSELEAALAALLAEEGLLVKPVVLINVAEYSSRPVSVVGAVKRPLTFQAMGRVTLLDAIARAEGLADTAGPDVIVISYPAEKRLVQRFPIRDLIDEAKPEMNVLLQGGEEIRVPEARRIFVTGNVKKPGAFLVRDNAQMTVLKALALSEGLSPYPQKFAYVYRNTDGGKGEIQVELAKIIRRKAIDFPLLPDDTLYIPEDETRRRLMGTTEKVVAFGMATASGVLIWKR